MLSPMRLNVLLPNRVTTARFATSTLTGTIFSSSSLDLRPLSTNTSTNLKFRRKPTASVVEQEAVCSLPAMLWAILLPMMQV